VIGVTGHGKSQFCTYLYTFLTGQHFPLFKISANKQSTHMDSLVIADKVGKGQGKIIDTPGWADSRG
jgi:predicted GTPase